MFEKINHQRRRFLGTAAITIATTQLGRFGFANAQSSKTKPAVQAMVKPGTNTSFGLLKQIDAGVLNVRYAEAGSANGRPVILLHGWPYDIHSYVDVAPLLASAEYRVIVPYLRGRLWYDALSFKRDVPQWAAVGDRCRYYCFDGCAQDRAGDPRWL